MMAADRLQVVSHPLRFLLQRHVRQVVDRVDRSRPVRIEPSELGIQVVWRRASGGDEFESAFGKTPTRREEPKRAEPTVRRESYVPPPPGAGSDVKESLGNSDIMEVVLANKPALIKCSDEEHQKEPGTTGKLVMRWSIQSNGKVSNVVVVSEEFKNTYMAACVGKVIKSWTFPRSKNPPEPFTLPVKF